MGIDLLDRLNQRGFELVAVLGPDEETLPREAQARGIPYIKLLPEFRWSSARLRKALDEDWAVQERLAHWVDQVRLYQPEVGLSYFSAWIPPNLLGVPARGWINFHPAPLPQLRGFLPEDFALLWGWKSMRGTFHIATNEIDEGAIIEMSRPARLNRWDTPDSIMQKVGETAKACVRSALHRFLTGRSRLTEQKMTPGFMADYAVFYPWSYLDWTEDSHETLHRKFQTFRGQNHRVDLKATVNGDLWRIDQMELHARKARGTPGDILGNLRGFVVVRTREGLALIQGLPFVRDPNLPEYLDRKVQDVVPPGRRPSLFTQADLVGF